MKIVRHLFEVIYFFLICLPVTAGVLLMLEIITLFKTDKVCKF